MRFQGRLRDRVLGTNKAVPMPYLGTLGIMYEGRPCMIPTVNVQTSVPTLSALQLVKGVKKGEETFVAELKSLKSSKILCQGTMRLVPPSERGGYRYGHEGRLFKPIPLSCYCKSCRSDPRIKAQTVADTLSSAAKCLDGTGA
ncbi:hypothetical protein Tco_0227767 [Tanacetum coccineum]